MSQKGETHLEVLLARETPLLDVALEAADGVLCGPHALDLLAGTVGGAGVGHGVATIAVRDELEEKRALLLGDSPVTGVAHGLEGRDDVHSVDLEAGNLIAASVVGGVGRGTLGRRAHAVFVVFADEDTRQVP